MLARRALITLPAATDPSTEIRASTISPSSTRAARVSPIPRSISHSRKRISRGLQKHARLGQRQADDVGIAAGEVTNIDLAVALERIAAGLAAPFAMAGVIIDFLVAHPFHRDHRLDQPLAHA